MIGLTNNIVIDEKGLQVKHTKHSLNNSAFVALTRSFSQHQIVLQDSFQYDHRYAAMHFIFNGRTIFTQNGLVPPADFSGDKCNLMLIQPNPTSQTISAKGNFAMASFYIELSYFIKLLNLAIEALPEKFQRAIYKNVCSCNNFRWSPQAYYIINQLLNVNIETSKLFMESKMLELIAVLLETEHCDYYSNITLSKSDIEKIYYVHEYLLTDISRCYTLDQLARKAGTNEFVLKKGFREIFGKPVYQYLLQRRMEKAMDLLLSTHLPVREIAMLVGYEDASAFTRAFKRVFSLLPAMVRKDFTLR